MKAKQREIYLALMTEVDCQLCSFCKQGITTGSSCDDNIMTECDHPLEDRLPSGNWGLEPGQDCWGFVPSHSVDYIAEVVAIILREGYKSVSIDEKDGMILVHGTKD
jgi:hypothetical protein